MVTKFTHAAQGISRVFWAQILVIIASICTSFAISGLINLNAISVVIFSLIGAIIAIVALILELTGLKTASADHKDFQRAFNFSLAALLISVIFAIVQAIWPDVFGSTASTVMTIVSSLLELFSIYFVIRGGVSLLNDRKEEGTATLGERAWTCCIVAVLCAVVISILMLFNVPAVVSGILAIVALIFGLIGDIAFLVFLGKAKNRLD